MKDNREDPSIRVARPGAGRKPRIEPREGEIMIYTDLTKRAMRMAYDAHMGQFGECGVPYVFHPLHLAESMTSEDSCCAALLHDAIEDTALTLEDLKAAGMSPAVIDAVRLLTRSKAAELLDPATEEAAYLDYVRALSASPIAREVKLADLAHNSDLTRLPRITGEDIERNRLYGRALAILLETSG